MRLFLISACVLGSLAGCATGPTIPNPFAPRSAASVTESFSARAARAMDTLAETAGKSAVAGATVTATRADGGEVIAAPTDDGGFVAYLDLPDTNACGARLTAGDYVLAASIGDKSVTLSLQDLTGARRIGDISVPVTRISDDAPVSPMARISLGPESFTLGRWFRCSDGLGHCGYAITLDRGTEGCS